MFNVGDKIVYPMHGAGTIDAIEEKDILGEKQNYYIIKLETSLKSIKTRKESIYKIDIMCYNKWVITLVL